MYLPQITTLTVVCNNYSSDYRPKQQQLIRCKMNNRHKDISTRHQAFVYWKSQLLSSLFIECNYKMIYIYIPYNWRTLAEVVWTGQGIQAASSIRPPTFINDFSSIASAYMYSDTTKIASQSEPHLQNARKNSKTVYVQSTQSVLSAFALVI